MENQFQMEQNEALKAILSSIYSIWSLPLNEQKKYISKMSGCSSNKDFMLELYITASCNQKCSYCYLTKNGEQLYPLDLRSEDTIIKNLEIYLDYSIKNGYNYYRVDLFSGEIWHLPFGKRVLETILKYIKKGLKIGSLVIPTNFSFCEKDSTIEIIEYYIKELENFDTKLCFSCSIDGLIVDKMNRPFNDDREKTSDFYSKIFTFCKMHEIGFHPMIAANNIEYQKENYDNWIKVMQFGLDDNTYLQSHFAEIMQLMVRNNDWSEEKIKKYLDWVNYVMEKDIELFFNSDIDLFFNKIYSDKETYSGYYLPYKIEHGYFDYACTLGSMLAIRLGDLSIVPCHRLSYDKFILGKFIVENDKIVDVEAKNIQMASAIFLTNGISKPYCDCCPINSYCMKGCIGSQYETLNEPFCPIPSVCELLKASFLFLYLKHEKLGAFNIPIVQDKLSDINTVYKNLVIKENCQKWINYIQTLI